MYGLKKARNDGALHYVGRPCECASKVRYVSNHHCVFCTSGSYETTADARARKARYRARQKALASPWATILAKVLGTPLTGHG
jgi:hypothetical protein